MDSQPADATPTAASRRAVTNPNFKKLIFVAQRMLVMMLGQSSS